MNRQGCQDRSKALRILLIDCHPDNWKDRVPFYTRLLDGSGQVSVVDYRSVSAGSVPGAFDAAVITGSPMMLSLEVPPAGLCDFIRGLAFPILGICFGHQLLGLLSGAKVYSGEKIEGLRPVRVLRPDPLFSDLPLEVSLLESHREFLKREEVEERGWEVLAVSDSCSVEAMRHGCKPWYGVQFHPERSGPSGAAVVQNFLDYAAGRSGKTQCTLPRNDQ